MADTRSRFFVLPFDPDKPIEEVTNAGIAQKRLKAMGNAPMAVGIEYLATGYRQLMGKDPVDQAVEVLMRRVLRGMPETVKSTREIAELREAANKIKKQLPDGGSSGTDSEPKNEKGPPPDAAL